MLCTQPGEPIVVDVDCDVTPGMLDRARAIVREKVTGMDVGPLRDKMLEYIDMVDAYCTSERTGANGQPKSRDIWREGRFQITRIIRFMYTDFEIRVELRGLVPVAPENAIQSQPANMGPYPDLGTVEELVWHGEQHRH